MFSNFTTAMYFAIGFSGWVYFKLQRRNGNNTKESVIATIAVFLLTLLALNVLLGLFGDLEPKGIIGS